MSVDYLFKRYRSRNPEKIADVLGVRLAPENMERVADLIEGVVIRTKVRGGSMMNSRVESLELRADTGDWVVAAGLSHFKRIEHKEFLELFDVDPVPERTIR